MGETSEPGGYTPKLGPCQRGRSLQRTDQPEWMTPCPRQGEALAVIDLSDGEGEGREEDRITLALCKEDMAVLEEYGVFD